MLGQTISHYRILEKLGEGGMGVVYKAEDLKLQRTVALKFLRPEALESEEHKTRFLHEAQAAAALNHPNICTIHEIDEADGRSFIAMEFIEGQSLRQKIEARPLPMEEALDIAIQMGQGLEAAHEKEIVHRDIKGANVMLPARGPVKIMDFGLAHLAGRTRITKDGATLGTPAYMSPEQVQGEDADRRTDVWSLGVVLYEMISGQLPFKGEVEAAVSYGILNVEPEPLTALRAGLPLELDRIVGKALAKDPDERYQRVDGILIDLRAVGAGLAQPERPTRRKRSYLPIVVAAIFVLLIAAGIYLRQPPVSGEASVAVLPLRNLSADPDQEYLSDGLTYEVITQLTAIRALRVTNPGSVMGFKDTDLTPSEIARRLNVAYIVEGSVQRAGDRVAITVQLTHAAEGRGVWADRYEDTITSSLELRSKVAQAIAREIQVKLTVEETQRLASGRPVNREAYESYLKGRFYLEKFTPEGATTGLGHLQRAIREDPDYAPAYAGLAMGYRLLILFGLTPGRESIPKTKAAAERAVELDDTLAEAHAAVGAFESFAWNWPKAEREFRRAIELNPGLSWPHHFYALACLAPQGRLDPALAEMQRTLELNPLSLQHNTIFAGILHYQRKYDQAIQHLQETLALDPNFPIAHMGLARAYVAKGMYEQAIPESRKAEPYAPQMLALIHANAGRPDEARKILQELIERYREAYYPPTWIGWIYVGLGDKDRAFEWFEKAYEDRDTLLAFMLKVEPDFDPLRSDPRYAALLRKMNLEP